MYACSYRSVSVESFHWKSILVCVLSVLVIQNLSSIVDIMQAGAEVHPTLEPAHLILGIKETPLRSLITSPVYSTDQNVLVPRTHVMFSHTAKGQEYNMPLLSRFLVGGDRYADPKLSDDKSLPQLAARLIDYELLTGPDGKRTVAFGWHAGGA
jgi:alpha-aminoadipic semialdehyde synthase